MDLISKAQITTVSMPTSSCPRIIVISTSGDPGRRCSESPVRSQHHTQNQVGGEGVGHEGLRGHGVWGVVWGLRGWGVWGIRVDRAKKLHVSG